jgi:molybdenum cofactor cytidylyltransferase
MLEHRFGVIVLAAGASRRMGTPKQMLRVGGRSLIRRAAQTALNVGAQRVIVVLGAHASTIQPELDGLEVCVTLNPAWNSGMGSSIGCGVATLLREAPGTAGALLLVTDQPCVSSASLRKLWQACAGEPSGAIVASRYNEVVGTPVFFGRDYFAELLRLEGDQGARCVLKLHKDRLRTEDLPEGAFDLDTPEDFAALRLREFLTLQTSLPSSCPARRRDSRSPMNPKDTDSHDDDEVGSPAASVKSGHTRRQFISQAAAAGAGVVAAPTLVCTSGAAESVAAPTALVADAILPVKLLQWHGAHPAFGSTHHPARCLARES